MDRDGRSYRARGHAGVPVIAATGWKTGWNREKRDMVSLDGGWLVSINVLPFAPYPRPNRSVLSIVLLFSTSPPPPPHLSVHNNFDGQPICNCFFDAKQVFFSLENVYIISGMETAGNSVFRFIFIADLLRSFALLLSLSFLFFVCHSSLSISSFFSFWDWNEIRFWGSWSSESTDRWIILIMIIVLLSFIFSKRNSKLGVLKRSTVLITMNYERRVFYHNNFSSCKYSTVE